MWEEQFSPRLLGGSVSCQHDKCGAALDLGPLCYPVSNLLCLFHHMFAFEREFSLRLALESDESDRGVLNDIISCMFAPMQKKCNT